MAISKALKYSRKNMVDEWNLDNLTKDIDKEEHTILLNALNNNNSESSNNITVSKNIKLFNLQIFLICIYF